MPIPSEGLDAHFLPSAGRKRETSNSIFCESADGGVQKLRFARLIFLSRSLLRRAYSGVTLAESEKEVRRFIRYALSTGAFKLRHENAARGSEH